MILCIFKWKLRKWKECEKFRNHKNKRINNKIKVTAVKILGISSVGHFWIELRWETNRRAPAWRRVSVYDKESSDSVRDWISRIFRILSSLSSSHYYYFSLRATVETLFPRGPTMYLFLYKPAASLGGVWQSSTHFLLGKYSHNSIRECPRKIRRRRLLENIFIWILSGAWPYPCQSVVAQSRPLRGQWR